jgi:hypothetical protein
MAVLTLGVLILIATGLWLWMAWANKRGRSWARIMATVFFGVLTAGELVALIEFLTHSSGSTLVVRFLQVSLFLVYWLVSLSAVVLLWQPSSSDYYAAAGNRSKAIRLASRKPHDQPAVRLVAAPIRTETGFPVFAECANVPIAGAIAHATSATTGRAGGRRAG